MKAAGKPADAPTPESEDIAKLLRALNEDLKADPIDDVADLDEDEEEPQASRGLPLGKIAAALVAAAGIGFAVVMLDPGGGTPPEPAATTTTAALVPPAPAITRAPTPAGQGAAPESMIARAPAPAAPPAATQPPPASTAPAPPPPVAAPMAPPPALKTPEPPALPPMAAAPAPRPAPPKPAEPPPAAPAPRAEAPKADPVPPPPPAGATTTTVTAPKTAETGDLQAMLAPPKDPREAKRAPAKPAEAKAAEPKASDAKPGESKPAAAAKPPATAAAAPAGRYTVQIGSFKVAENAESLVRRLQGGGFSAYTLDWTDASNQSWRAVRVGGYADSAAAKRAAGELKTKMGLDSVVVTTR